MKNAVHARLAAIAARSTIPFEVSFPDGARLESAPGPHAFAIRIRNRRALLRGACFGHIGLLDAYFDQDIDIEGDLASLFSLGLEAAFDTPNPLIGVRNWWHEFRRNNATRERARANARFHYGLGEPFYRLWLDDPLMMYTCAYWVEGTSTLEEAQRNKVEHVCRKVRLQPGETVVDIGCGFGGFMFHAAERHGVHVTGTNITTEQVREVARTIAASPLAGRLKLIEADFRDPVGEYDKVVSIGVLEHAGRDQVDDVVKAHAAALKPGGLGMLHFIGHMGTHPTEFFIRDHVFPGGWIPALSEVLESMDRHGLQVIDIENLRRHYAFTLDEWARRFEARWPTIHALDPRRFDERFRRIWRTYLLGCAQMFRASNGITHLFQITFSRGAITPATYPMSRAFMYETPVRELPATPPRIAEPA